jgi:hypothetical protein
MYNSGNRFYALAELLNMGLRSKAINSTDLAEKITIEKIEKSTIVRTVGKIVSGERLPPKKDLSTYLNHFSEVLSISFEDLEKAYDEDIKKEQRERKKRDVSAMVSILASSHSTNDNKKDTEINIWGSEGKLTIALNTKNDLRMAMISMLENLDQLDSKHKQLSIYLTYQGKKSVFSSNCADGIGMEDRWSSAIESTMKKGYRFVHLVRMGSDQLRIQEIVLRIVSFIGEQDGNYELRALQENIVLQPSYGMFIVPYINKIEGKIEVKRQAIISFSVEESEMNDGGILTKDEDIIHLTAKHIERIESHSTQVFQRFDNYAEMFDKISASDQKSGKRYVFLKRLSEITRPLEWYDLSSDWANKLCDHIKLKSDEDRENHIKQRLKRRIYLEKHLRQYPCYHIYSKSIFMQDLTASGSNDELSRQFKVNDQEHYFIPNDKQRKEQLESILKLLLTKNFYIGLIDDEGDNEVLKEYFNKIKLNFCEVNDENLVFMEVPVNINHQVEYQRRWYFTQNRIVARSFQTYFSNLWDTIPENQKDINIIYEELNAIKNRL